MIKKSEKKIQKAPHDCFFFFFFSLSFSFFHCEWCHFSVSFFLTLLHFISVLCCGVFSGLWVSSGHYDGWRFSFGYPF